MPAAGCGPGGAAGGGDTRPTPRREVHPALLIAAALGLLLLAAACGGSDEAPPTATPSPIATAVATPKAGGGSSGAAEQFDAEKALAHVRVLAVDIGSRPAGGAAERQAADYIRGQLADYGYEASLEGFTFTVFEDTGSSLTALSPQERQIEVTALEPSISGLVEAGLVDAGRGRPEEFPAGTAGKIALIERGELRFGEKVANAAAAGAAAAIVYNSEPGQFQGNLGEAATIPAASISQEDGQALLELLKAGPVTVRLDARTESGRRDSQNVVGRPPEGACRVVVGGHYDSVPVGPGANDNASGTATALEMARTLAADGEIEDVCFALFGAEEVGLVGSAAFVAGLSPGERRAIEGMLNFDMVGVGSRWLLAGSLALRDVTVEQAKRLGFQYTVLNDPLAGSDHASFLDAGIPAVFLHRAFAAPADDPRYHTAGDTVEFVEAANVGMAGELGLAVVPALLTGR